MSKKDLSVRLNKIHPLIPCVVAAALVPLLVAVVLAARLFGGRDFAEDLVDEVFDKTGDDVEKRADGVREIFLADLDVEEH